MDSITDNNDTFISSLTALKQLLQQQQQQKSVVKSPITKSINVVDKVNDDLRKKLIDAERVIENERSLRKTLEKAFDELTVNRKLLQEQLDEIQQQIKEQRTVGSSSNDTDEGDDVVVMDSDQSTKETVAIDTSSWEMERIQLLQKIQQLEEDALVATKEHEKYVQEQMKIQQSTTAAASELEAVDQKRTVELQTELESLRKDHETWLAIITSALPKDNFKIESDLTAAVKILVTQLQECQKEKVNLEGEVNDARKEVERLEEALGQMQPNLDEDSTSGSKDDQDMKDDTVMTDSGKNVDHKDSFGVDVGPEEAKERQILKEEVSSLRRALSDAIGEASKSQGLLNSLETRLNQKKSLVLFCEKMKEQNEEWKRLNKGNVVIATDRAEQQMHQQQQQPTSTESDNITEDKEDSGDDLKNELYETRQLLEQNKKLVTILRNKTQKHESEITAKDEQIRNLTVEARHLNDDLLRERDRVMYFENLYKTNDDDDNDEEEEDHDDDNNEEEEENVNANEEESDDGNQEGNDQEVVAESVEIIDVSDDESNEDIDDVGQNEMMEEEADEEEEEEGGADHAEEHREAVAAAAAAASNVVEQSEDDETTDEPSPKKQRVDLLANAGNDNVVMERDDDNDGTESAYV